MFWCARIFNCIRVVIIIIFVMYNRGRFVNLDFLGSFLRFGLLHDDFRDSEFLGSLLRFRFSFVNFDGAWLQGCNRVDLEGVAVCFSSVYISWRVIIQLGPKHGQALNFAAIGLRRWFWACDDLSWRLRWLGLLNNRLILLTGIWLDLSWLFRVYPFGLIISGRCWLLFSGASVLLFLWFSAFRLFWLFYSLGLFYVYLFATKRSIKVIKESIIRVNLLLLFHLFFLAFFRSLCCVFRFWCLVCVSLSHLDFDIFLWRFDISFSLLRRSFDRRWGISFVAKGRVPIVKELALENRLLLLFFLDWDDFFGFGWFFLDGRLCLLSLSRQETLLLFLDTCCYLDLRSCLLVTIGLSMRRLIRSCCLGSLLALSRLNLHIALTCIARA